MSWTISISHKTRYIYKDLVDRSYNELRMIPMETKRQSVSRVSASIKPFPYMHSYRDYFGSNVIFFNLTKPHKSLEIEINSHVITEDKRELPTKVTWRGLLNDKRYANLVEYILPTAVAPFDAKLSEICFELTKDLPPTEAVMAIMNWIRREMSYQSGSTAISTSSIEAWHQGYGVCQDFAHLGISLLRSIGIPARYVSGYFFHLADSEKTKTIGNSHAWLEVWLGDWYPFDPTNAVLVDERYIILARGRDYFDVPPIRGVYFGPEVEESSVAVELRKVS
ncbi:MAG: transglutaminase family protein [Firmicutes bacterium]|nr:transglutaminase family protein [Bacillota bacterium]